MIIAGLTGGIASGKSTVVDMLREAGAVIIDADQIARQVVAPKMPAWKEICALFGKGILMPDGTIDRDSLGDLVFKDPAARRRLEAIIHPRVGEEIDKQLRHTAQHSPRSVVIMDIPLLFETQHTQGLNEIIVVYAPRQLQLERLRQRNQLSQEDAEARINSQMPIEDKKKIATLVIDNSGSLAHTRTQTLAVYRQLLTRV